MAIFAAAISLAAAGSASAETWAVTSDSTGDLQLIDRTSIEAAGAIRRATVAMLFRGTRMVGPARVDYMVSREEADCSNRLIRSIQITAYNAEGANVGSSDNPGTWETVEPGTFLSQRLEYLCVGRSGLQETTDTLVNLLGAFRTNYVNNERAGTSPP